MGSKGFRVTMEDLDTGSTEVMVVSDGDYVLIPFEPCYVAHQAFHANGSVQITLKGSVPEWPARREGE